MAGHQGATQTEDGGTGSFRGAQQDALGLGLLGVGVVGQGDDWGPGSGSPSLNFPYATIFSVEGLPRCCSLSATWCGRNHGTDPTFRTRFCPVHRAWGQAMFSFT